MTHVICDDDGSALLALLVMLSHIRDMTHVICNDGSADATTLPRVCVCACVRVYIYTYMHTYIYIYTYMHKFHIQKETYHCPENSKSQSDHLLQKF